MESKKDNEELKTVDLTVVEVEVIDGTKEKLCLVEKGKATVVGMVIKQFANAIYSQSKDLGEVEIARKLYKEGKAEMTKQQAESIKKYMENFPYILSAPISAAFDIFK